MRIKTEILKGLVAKAIKGASNNKMIPITGFIGLELVNGKLTLTTTDGNNILKVFSQVEDTGANDFYTVVNADVFAKLVGKLTREFVDFELSNSSLLIKSNGKYTLDIPVDSEGNVVKFNQLPEFNDRKQINTDLLQSILDSASVAVDSNVAVLTGYYFGDCVMTTDRERVCYIDTKIFDTPILLADSSADLLQLFNTETLGFSQKGNELLFESDNICLYCKELEDKEQYPVQPILNLMNTAYENPVQVPKNDLLEVLDRMSLFVTNYDKGGVYLTLENDTLSITSQKSNAIEKISITSVPEKFECLVDIEMLKSEVQKVVADSVELYYGDKSSLKIKEGNTIMILALKHPENN